jgi:hypothetical protein
MLPTQDFNHVAESLALLTGQFSSDLLTPNVRNLVRVKARRKQYLENLIWAVINSQLLSLPPAQGGPSGQALNQLAALVGQVRGALTDVQLLLFIKVIIVARRSGGRSEDLNAVMQAALGRANFQMNDYYPGRVDLYAPGLATDEYAQPLAQALHLARPPAVYTLLSYWDTPSYVLPIFTLGDSVSGTGGTGFADSVSGSNPTVPISCLVC